MFTFHFKLSWTLPGMLLMQNVSVQLVLGRSVNILLHWYTILIKKMLSLKQILRNLQQLASKNSRKEKQFQNYLFQKKKVMLINYQVEVNHIELVSNYNILDIPCSFTKLLSVETKTELDRECESCVKWLVDQIEINKLYSRHGPSLDFILFRQKSINFSNINNFYKFPLNIN